MIVKSPQSEPTLVLVTVSKDYNFLDVEIAHGLVDNHRFAIEAELTDTTSVDGRKAEMYAIPMDKELTRKIAESNYFRLRMGWRTGKAAFSLSDSPIIDQAQALIDTKNI